MGDEQIVISSGQVFSPDTVASRSFTSAFRGYHPGEVRQFLKRVGDELAAGAGREAELRRALQDALARAAHPDLDEATLTTLLGEHAAQLLASARETAASIAAEAQRQADDLRRDAEGRVARMREEADGLMARRVAEADATADSIRQAATSEAQTVVEEATRQGREMVAQARDVRERMLSDLTRRRRGAELQVEQLRAARDRLLGAYDVVRRTVEEATGELEAAEPEAREAAAAVARRAGEVDVALRLAPRGDTAPARRAEPEHRAPVVTGAVAPAVRDPRPMPAPSALLRRVQSPTPPEPEQPRLRPQTVADAVAGRPPASDRAATPVAPVSELATMEVPVVVADVPVAKVEELFARMRAGRPEPEPEPEPEPPAVDPVATEDAIEGRDELLENLEAGLTRALKRVLQDEQNEVLDRLRRLGASPGPAALPDLGTQAASYRDAAVPWLQQAARAGAGSVTDPAAARASRATSPPGAAEAVALALARELVEPLRERLARAVDAATDADDPSVVAESVRAAYRQWKVQHVEECARHHALAAFSAGAFGATPAEAHLQWLVHDDGHCPDCDDNALAGPTVKGQPFPTGQLYPPAHPGCRCLLVPARA